MSDREDYYAKARDWASDARARDGRLVRIAWTVAGIAAAIAIFEAVALALLTPLKTVQPVTLLVDRQTGYVQALDPLKPPKIAADTALTQSQLAQYVMAREGFDRATVSADYRRVALWSGGLARTQYLAMMPATNPDSPFQRLPAGSIVTARIKSVSALSPGTALVRFDTQQQDRSGRLAAVQPWISVVRFSYSNAPMRFEDRLVNPLGFQVTSYRRDAEAPPMSIDAQTAPTSAPIAAPAVSDRPAASLPAGSAPASLSTQMRMPAAAIGATPSPEALLRRGIALNQIPLGSPLVSATAPTPLQTASSAP